MGRLASLQQWSDQHARKARVDAIRDEIIKHCLPNGIRIGIEQDDDKGYVDLDEDQYIEVYRAICRKAGKNVRCINNACLLELKKAPFVNILDFVDSFSTGGIIPTFDDWDEFVDYILNDRKIDNLMAKENEFLAPLQQNLVHGPNNIDPQVVRDRHTRKRAAVFCERKRRHMFKQQSVTIKPEPPRELSPSTFDRIGSSPSSPIPVAIAPSPPSLQP